MTEPAPMIGTLPLCRGPMETDAGAITAKDFTHCRRICATELELVVVRPFWAWRVVMIVPAALSDNLRATPLDIASDMAPRLLSNFAAALRRLTVADDEMLKATLLTMVAISLISIIIEIQPDAVPLSVTVLFDKLATPPLVS